MSSSLLKTRIVSETGHPRPAWRGLLASLCAACCIIPAFTRGIHSPILAAAPALILLSGWLLGRKAMLTVTALLSLAVLGYAAAGAGGWLSSEALPSSTALFAIFILTQAATALIAYAMLGASISEGRRAAVNTKPAESEPLFRALLTSLHDGLLVVDCDGKVEYANQQLCAIYSIDSPPQAFVGRDSGAIMLAISNMYPDPGETRARLRKIIQEGVPRLGTELVLKNGRTLMRDFIPFEYGDGRSGRIWHMHDVTALRNAQTQLIEANHKLESLSLTDGLTGLGNRRHFDQELLKEWSRAQRQGHVLALLLLDVDWFKSFNDHYGHPAGDACLQAIAKTLKGKARRAGDLTARYGGEEFVLIAPGTSAGTAMALAESVRQAVHDIGHPHKGSPIGIVTVSIGVAAIAPGKQHKPELFLQAADQALYRAKSLGRNQVAAAHELLQ